MVPEVKVGCLLQLLLHLPVEDEGDDEEDPEHEEDHAGEGVDDLDDAEVGKVLLEFAKQDEKALQVGTDLLQIHFGFWKCCFGFVSYFSKVFLVLHENICQAYFQDFINVNLYEGKKFFVNAVMLTQSYLSH